MVMRPPTYERHQKVFTTMLLNGEEPVKSISKGANISGTSNAIVVILKC